MKEAKLSSTNPQTKAMALSNSYNFNFEGLEKKAIERACHVSIKKVYKNKKPYVVDTKLSDYIIIAFPGSWSEKDWYAGDKPFGETEINLELFPSLRSIGNDEPDRGNRAIATVNQAFLQRFCTIKSDEAKPSFTSDVNKYVEDKRKIIFAGHSSGGPIAIFAATWFFEEHRRSKDDRPPNAFCLTFGSPLIADSIFCHAMRREKWSDYFINFVTRYDIVPRILLAPLSSIEDKLEKVLSYFKPGKGNLLPETEVIKDFFEKVMKNASCAANYAACNLRGGTDDLLSTLCNYIDCSPYRPFGTYIYCSESGKSLAVKNPSAALQLLFYSSLLSSEVECARVASESLKCHLAYKTQLQSMEMQNVTLFDKFQEIPIFLDNGGGDETNAINAVLNGLGLNERGRVSLHAAIEFEKQKVFNQNHFEGMIPERTEEEKRGKKERDNIEELMKTLESYKAKCEARRIGYYDSFKESQYEDDFQANVARLKLAGIWDEIIEMLQRYELPDTFEGEEKWVELGTKYRRLVEPLDIANFYRHSKHGDSGTYMGKKGRPRRYRYTQRWQEHFEKSPGGSHGESCFWAYLEDDLLDADKKNTLYINVTDKVKETDKNLKKWHDAKLIRDDVFFQDGTLIKWWNRLPEPYREVSAIKEIIQPSAP